jgi:hypothetical protein
MNYVINENIRLIAYDLFLFLLGLISELPISQLKLLGENREKKDGENINYF